MTLSTEDLAAILTALVSLIVSIGALRKSKAETDNHTALAAAAIQEASVELLVPLRERVVEIEERLEEVREEHRAANETIRKLSGKLVTLRQGIEALIKQIRALGAAPVWLPDE